MFNCCFKAPLLILFALGSIALFGQSQPSGYSIEAQQLQKNGRIPEAIALYKLDYNNTLDKWEALEIAALYAIADSVDASISWLSLAMKTDSSLIAMEDSRFFKLLNTPAWEVFEQSQIKKYELKNGQFKNLPLTRKLWRIGMKDQAYSYEINVVNRLLGETSPITKALWDLQKKNRQENLDEVETILRKKGWPKVSEIGEEASEKVFWVVQHAEGERARKRFLPKLKAACEKNEAKWEHYATMYDRLALAETGKQLYGTQMTRNKDGSIELCPLDAPEYVEKRRKALGLSLLIPALERLGIEFNVLQKE
ncbi:MAG: hypothetical protein IT258_16015 [Saprospiraceae bacterium]|nr:hypothetical protein [Saprospiraceae bacterium]